MAQQQIRLRTKLWKPSTPAVDATDVVFSIKAGERVVWASAMPVTAASAGAVGTVSLGDGAGVASYVAAITPTVAVQAMGTIIPGVGAYFDNSGGKLYAADDTIDATWDYTSGTTTLVAVRFTIGVVKEYPI
jgi:hypothetical protein